MVVPLPNRAEASLPDRLGKFTYNEGCTYLPAAIMSQAGLRSEISRRLQGKRPRRPSY